MVSAMAAGTILYAMIAVLAPFIIDDFDISRAELGWLLTAYAAVSAITAPIIGAVTDRIGARNAMLTVLGAVAVGFLLMSAVPSYALAFGVVLVIGIGQTMSNPATNKMIAHEVATGRRGLVTGIKQAGVQAGVFIGGVTFPAIAGRFGWHAVPAVIATLVAVAFAVGVVTLPRHDREPVAPLLRGTEPLPPSTWWITAYALLMGAGGSPVFAFLPLYGVEAVGVTEATAGLVVGLSALLGVAARILWSVGAERLGEFAWPMVAIALIAVLAGIATILAEPLGVIVLWISAVLGYLSISAWNSVAMLAVIVEAGPRAAGRASGIVLLGFLAGLGLSPPLFGWSVDRLGTYRPGFGVVTGLFALAALTMLAWIRRSRRLDVRFV